MSVIGNNALEFTEEQGMLMDVAREFCRDKSAITAVRAQLESQQGFDQGVWDEIVALGWAGMALPESCGGSGLGVGSMVPVAEAMGRAMLGTPLLGSTLAGQLLVRSGSAARLESLLSEIAAGAIASLALLDSADWGDERTRCELDADGVLHGGKKFVVDAASASLFVVPVLHHSQTALVVVRAGQLSEQAITPNTLIDQTRRSADVDFSGVRIDDEMLVTGEAVTTALRDVRLLGALLCAAEAAGSAAACLDTTVEYLKTRKQFGKLIGSYQALKHPAVDILVGVDSTRSFVYHGATLVGDAPLDEAAEIACRMAKAQATDTLTYAADRAVQFHGGMGFTYECDAQLYIRRAQWHRQQFGDAMHHRKRLAALLLDR